MNELTYSYAASLQERLSYWETLDLNQFVKEDTHVVQWMQRKSLLESADFLRIFHFYGKEKARINQAMQPLTETYAHALLPKVQESTWFQLHQQLFQHDCAIQEISLQAALRFHLAHYRSVLSATLKDYKNVLLFSAEVVEKLVQQLEAEFFFLSEKTLAWDVHAMNEEEPLQGETEEARFQDYVTRYLGTKEATASFYAQYPTLARLLATRLHFACENLTAFIKACQKSKEALITTFQLNFPLQITALQLGKGDSHPKGKSVIQFQTPEAKLFFKFKDLTIGERLNEWFSVVETWLPTLDFYHVKRVVQPTYTFEEAILHVPCKNEAEIQAYYRNYGYLLAVAYWLGATDLHMENLIAKGAQPVLVDVETLIKAKLFAIEEKGTKQQNIENHSVLVSGLLPQNTRALAEDALSGGHKPTTVQMNRMQQSNTTNVHFTPVEQLVPDANNIPIYQGKKVDYRLYAQEIERAFCELNQCFLTRKAELLQLTEQLFADVSVRLIFRDTQDYTNLLYYTLHPDCMSNYLEREKVLENAWAAKSVPEMLVPYELDALHDQDIPLFVGNTSTTTVESDTKSIPNVLTQTPLAYTLQHMTQITEKTSHLTHILLKESLGMLAFQSLALDFPLKNTNTSQPLLQKAIAIGDYLLAHVDWQHKEAHWLTVTKTAQGECQITYPDNDLYEGAGGLYLFLRLLTHVAPHEKYAPLLQKLEIEIFKKPVATTDACAYFGWGMQATLAYILWRVTGDAREEARLDQALTDLSQVTIASTDWLTGQASLLALLSTIYQETQKIQAKQLLEKMLYLFPAQPETTEIGFAHGLSGMLYALAHAQTVVPLPEIQAKYQSYQRVFAQQSIQEITSPAWCNGYAGISQAYPEVMQNISKSKFKSKKIQDDCLCHGRYGWHDNNLNNNFLLFEQRINLVGDPLCPPLGLFCGLAGIGYQLLRSMNSKIPSIIFF